ncbi:aminomethyl-transferring glycine dehydrogenase [Polluticaenibacter yanchengensis]|uniref:Glycine dehydrogenase (decarboxylating) n=1 Tax=Polluticaenibacter yanchengensis TaxID=3014562 RepID=A0ABT4ULB3_9BACT|nr:aminomethyl-transferring glycine dehydrogenase [Chitinophagaceae bacterium LY-5]
MSLFKQQSEAFSPRHIGSFGTKNEMLSVIGVESLNELIDKTVPASIRINRALNVPDAVSEFNLLNELKEKSLKNKVAHNFIGQGYYDTITPSVILRNIFENPGWYTQYTPYQAEISQGRLESLLNFQTVVSDLTGLPIANASLLDEATAAAETMNMFFHHVNRSTIKAPNLFVDTHVWPQTKALLIARGTPLGINIVEGDYKTHEIDSTYFGAIVQYPNNIGSVEDYAAFAGKVHAAGAYLGVATDLLALTLLKAPGEFGADVAFGTAQRFGVPLGYGGPHAAFFTTKDEFKRAIPGRIIGVSVDAKGNRALRMALQTREQHIKREKATSNICTAQALLANMAAMYAVYHGPQGLTNIAKAVHATAAGIAKGLAEAGLPVETSVYFDTLYFKADAARLKTVAEAHNANFRYFGNDFVGISVDEVAAANEVATAELFSKILSGYSGKNITVAITEENGVLASGNTYNRDTDFLTHPNFNTFHSESMMMRYIKQLENKDLSLNTSMISLGSCTMKLNAATEMIPVSWSHWSRIHPFAPVNQAQGYFEMIQELSAYLSDITGFDHCWLQPNSGAQGEFAGLLAIRNYHINNGQSNRDVILIPISAHGTNPASAVMVGMKVVVVKALENGYIDVEDFKAKAAQHSANLAGVMITYPSTYGIFEESVKEICDIVHQHGGQVYMDGANMNAQVGLTSPGFIGADVCHLNLHKTFAIPHGGGGPGVGPICFKKHLKSSFMNVTDADTVNTDELLTSHVSAAPYGSASILLISYAYIRLLGAKGLLNATQHAILNANYMKARLEKDYNILYNGANGTCAHEFIVDLRPLKTTSGIEAEDVAKRLMDYGFHAPTMSFPVAGTIMIEPTESEDIAELDRFCDALLSIRREIAAIENGESDKTDNALKNAPHTQFEVVNSEWDHSYTREEAAYPLPYTRNNKFWPSVARVNNTHGDRNLVCTCEPVSSYMEETVEA